jgi:uncharacterized protein YfaQ (DUF2300 family)
MPLEGHYERQTTPLYKLSARERRAAFWALVATLAAMLAVVLFTVSDSNPGPAQGCIRSQVAGIVGAETISACGRDAVQVCTRASHFEGARAETIVADCRAQGVRF